MSIDPDKLKFFSFLLFTKLEGAVTSGMVHLGDHLGLYRALAAAPQPLTTTQLAAATGLRERWVREWAYNQAAAKLISFSSLRSQPAQLDDDTFFLSPEQIAVLADESHPAFGMGMFHRLPQTMESLKRMPESFRTGLGYNYDSHGPDGAVGIERSFEPWNNANLIPTVLPATGMVDRLHNGVAVADIGCGAGGAVLRMAREYPASNFVGYDISHYALTRANERLRDSGLTNAHFADPRSEPLPSNNSLDFVCTFDCIHDMTHPLTVMQSIRAALRPNGNWLLVDIKAHDGFAMNAEKNPMASLMYGISVLSCMSSALSTPDGAGLGTLGLSEMTAENMARAAGFTQFNRLDIDHSINAFYLIRP
ncbi:MAG: class I SAM-dependent methyltransferase [Acidimicrobiaceae bacterium]|nr:class I SAM-dependent methyltransferase [Acidimicrobiaceae bacterium]